MKKKTKKHAKTTMAAAIAVGSVVAVAPMATQASTQFTDVKVTDYYYEDVLQLAARGVVNGFSDGTFKPKQDVTRGQAAKIIAGVLGLDTTNVSNPGFKDVTTSNQYYGAIAALANAGIINGFEDGTFRPGDAVQRNHMAKIIAGAFKLEAPADFKTPLKDVRADYAQYVTALYSAGVTTGKTATTFDGSSNVTRGQLASFVVRAENADNTTAPVAKDVTFTISQVDGSKVEGYIISTALHGLLNEANNAALEGAIVSAKVLGDEIVSINSLQLNAPGTEGALVTLDGGNSTIAGNLIVNADYVEVKNVTVQGNVSLSNSVKSEFFSDGLINDGHFIVEEVNSSVASLTPIFANTTKGLKIGFKNSNLKSVHVKRDNVSIASNVKLPELTVSAAVSTIQIDADVAKFKVDVTVNIAISGAGSFDEVALEKAVEVALNIVGNIAKLVVNSTDAKVNIAASIKIGEVTLPANTTAAGIIKNYESIKGNIDKVVSDNTTTKPPVSGGSGSSGGGSSSGGSGSGGSNPGVDTTVIISGVSAIIGADGKKITVTASVANTTASTATIEFYEVENGVVAPSPNYTRQADIKDGKVDFWTAELPAGTYQVKVKVGSVSAAASAFVTVLSGDQPPLTVGKVTNFAAASKDREIELTWSAVEGVNGYEIWYKLSNSDSNEWIRGWSEDTSGIEGTSSTIGNLENDKQYTFKITPYKLKTSGEKVYGEDTTTEATPSEQTTDVESPVIETTATDENVEVSKVSELKEPMATVKDNKDTGLTATASYKVVTPGLNEEDTATEQSYDTFAEALAAATSIGQKIVVTFTAKDTANNVAMPVSVTYTVVADAPADQEAPTGLGATTTTTQDGADGTITGLEASNVYQYKVVDAEAWTDVAANSAEITGLKAGKYEVRLAAKEGYNASPSTEVEVKDFVLAAPTGGATTMAAPGVTAAGAKFIVYGLNVAGTERQSPSTLTEVADFLLKQYGVTLNTSAINVTDGNIAITGDLLSTEDWNKIKANGDKSIPYQITLVKDGATAPVAKENKVVKVAIYEDGKAVLTSLQAADQDQEAPTGLGATTTTTQDGADGTITGLEASNVYQYKVVDAEAWTDVAANSAEITGLKAGKYEVRLAAKEGYNASPSTEVEVKDFVLAAPTGGATTMAAPGVTAAGAKFIVYGLNVAGTERQSPSTLTEVADFLLKQYGVTLNTSAINVTDGNIAITGDLLSTEDWNKIKANGDKSIPYQITLVKDGATAPVAKENKVVKVAIYEDGKAVLTSLQAADQDQEAPTGLGATTTTTQDGADGTITGLEASNVYQYKVVDAEAWTDVAANSAEITGLKAGKYEVRLAAKEGYNASPSTEVEVKDFVLAAPTGGATTMAAPGVTAAGAKFIVYGLNVAGTERQSPSTLTEVADFLLKQYGVTLNTSAINVTDGNIAITGDLLSTEDWNKIKANGDKSIPYQITLVKDGATAPVAKENKVVKVAIYEDGKAVLTSLQAADQDQEAPTGLGATTTTTQDGADGTITGLEASNVYQYKVVDAEAWTDVAANSAEITGLKAGKYEVRLAAKEGYNASPSTEVEVKDFVLAAPTGGATTMAAPGVTAAGAKFIVYGLNVAGTERQSPSTLTEVADFLLKQYGVTLNTSAINVTDGNIAITGDLLSTEDWNKIKANGDKSIPYQITLVKDGATAPVAKENKVVKVAIYEDGKAVLTSLQAADQDQEAPTGLGATTTTTQDGADGTITGLEASNVYQYKVVDAEAWTDVAANSAEITGLKAGKYEVRLAAKEGYNASPSTEVEVKDFVLAAPTGGATTMAAPGVTAAGAKFIVYGLNVAGTERQSPSTLTEVADFLLKQYGVTLNTSAINVTDGNIAITGDLLSTEDWNKIKANGDKSIPYQITLVKDGATAPVAKENKVVKVAIYEDGKAVLTSLQAADQDQEAPTGLGATTTTTQDGADGTITGLEASNVYQYKVVDAEAWTDVAANSAEITGLKAGKYEVRLAAKEGYNASPSTEVEVKDFVLAAPTGGATTMAAPGVTAAGAKFIVYGLNVAGTERQSPSTLTEVADFLLKQYGVTLNTSAINVTDGNIAITGDLLSTEDWNKIKANGDKSIPYQITLVKDGATAPVAKENKVVKVAIYEDGKAVLTSLQVEDQAVLDMKSLTTLSMGEHFVIQNGVMKFI